jgi:hypothetical protein
MPSTYRHTQIGARLRLAAILPAAPLVALGFLVGKPLLLSALAAFFACVAFAFSSLTIDVGDGKLAWSFGFGLLRQTVALGDIASATPVRNPWWYGWGVHLTPRGWLFNVDGLAAVEIALKDGRRFRLGSDDAERLAQALRTRTGLLGTPMDL